MSIDFDFSELTRLAADLGKAPRVAAANVVKALEVTANRVKDDWREPLEGSEHVPGGARAVTYEVTTGASILASAISAEVGPVIGGPGAIVGMLEYGTPSTGPRGFGAEALRKNQDDFERGVLKAAEDAF